MTTLFGEGPRTRMTGRRYSEPACSFLNTSAWPSVERVRGFWEHWFQEYPEDKQVALAARFRSSDDHPHLSALLELFTYAALRRSGYQLQVEPPIGDLALDFLIIADPTHQSFYVECTATGRQKVEVGADALEGDLLDALNKTPTDRFLLDVEIEKRGATAPPAKRLRTQLARWLSSLDSEGAANAVQQGGDLPQWVWAEDGWLATFRALRTIDVGEDGEDAVGMTLHTFVPDQHRRLRAALDGKASKYGSLVKPLLVVANSTQFQSDDDLITALLGDVIWLIDFAAKAGTTSRKSNGVLFDSKGPRNIGMSAVMHGHFGALSFAQGDRPITITHHPFAAHPLPHGLFPFCEERYFNSETDAMERIPPTITVAEFFGLEVGWPHFDQDPR